VKILLVCNRNLVRSIFAESFLKFHYPKIEFDSCGINASSFFAPTIEVASFLEKCGIPFKYRFSKNLGDVVIKKFDYLLFFDSVQLSFWIKLRYRKKILFLRDFYADPNNIPVDPLDFDVKELEDELVKMSLGLVKFARSIDELPDKFYIYEVGADSLSRDRLSRDERCRLERFDGVIVDLNFPNNPTLSPEIFGRNFLQLRINDCFQLERTDVIYRIICSQEDYLKILFSPTLKKALENCQRKFNTLIIGAPKSEPISTQFSLATVLWSQFNFDLILDAGER